jgi:hypothetical protein
LGGIHVLTINVRIRFRSKQRNADYSVAIFLLASPQKGFPLQSLPQYTNPLIILSIQFSIGWYPTKQNLHEAKKLHNTSSTTLLLKEKGATNSYLKRVFNKEGYALSEAFLIPIG